MTKKTRQRLLTLSFVIINVVVIGVIANNTFTNDSDIRFSNILSLWLENWPYLIVVLALPIIALIAEGLKYYQMIYFTTGERRLVLGLKTAILGKYYDNITPLGSGGQPAQVYYLYKNGVPSGTAGGITVSAFSMMQIAFTSIALVMFLFFGHHVESSAMRIAAYIGSAFAVFMPFIVIVFSIMPRFTSKLIYRILVVLKRMKVVRQPMEQMKKVMTFLNNFKDNLFTLTKSPRLVIQTFILSLIYQTALFAIPYFVVRASGTSAADVDFIQLYALCVFVYCAVAFIPTPGNSGGAEISFALIFSILQGGYLFWGMILWRFSSYFFVLIIGLITVLTDTLIRNRDTNEEVIE